MPNSLQFLFCKNQNIGLTSNPMLLIIELCCLLGYFIHTSNLHLEKFRPLSIQGVERPISDLGFLLGSHFNTYPKVSPSTECPFPVSFPSCVLTADVMGLSPCMHLQSCKAVVCPISHDLHAKNSKLEEFPVRSSR